MLNAPSASVNARTILVVEDEPDLATAIAQRITAQGWRARVDELSPKCLFLSSC